MKIIQLTRYIIYYYIIVNNSFMHVSCMYVFSYVLVMFNHDVKTQLSSEMIDFSLVKYVRLLQSFSLLT